MELEKVLSSGESETVEFKESFGKEVVQNSCCYG